VHSDPAPERVDRIDAHLKDEHTHATGRVACNIQHTLPKRRWIHRIHAFGPKAAGQLKTSAPAASNADATACVRAQPCR
jgi:hypothetical protein